MNQSRHARRSIGAALAAILACCALALASGCGSSGASSTASTPATTATSAPGSLKLNRTPRYASPASSAPVKSGVVAIAYRNIAIAPDTIKVRSGSTVTWTNYDAVEHNVTSDGGPQHFASGNFGERKSFAVKLTKPGVIHYLCTIHPTTMNGTIEVAK